MQFVLIIALVVSLGANVMQWVTGSELRDLARTACQTTMADDSRCGRLGLN
ncbi:hypothetical protein [Rhizobium sp. Leaf341]|uniref:hypothetical protein n=1 Tax=Rhizobium sp. Leaf341 TaxID=1736344 RepID=UPI000A6D0575|nr:hypothetical protein [Rhizobium sp. Leaf341]